MADSPPLPAKGAYTFDFDNYDESCNPFGTGNKMGTSPSGSDPFKMSSKVASSPLIRDNVDPFKSPSKETMSPDISDSTDPYTALDIGLSPLVHDNGDNRFQSSFKVGLSPLLRDDVDPFKSSTKVTMSPVIGNDIDPCKVTMSPVIGNYDPFNTSNKVSMSPVIGNDDPFKTSNKVSMSPVIGNDVDPFKMSNKVSMSPAIANDVDPFKISNTMPMSPVIGNDVDPLKASNKVSMSPVTGNTLETFKPSTKVGLSPLIVNNNDPFTKDLIESSLPKSPYSVTVKAAFDGSGDGCEHKNITDEDNFMDDELLDFARAEQHCNEGESYKQETLSKITNGDENLPNNGETINTSENKPIIGNDLVPEEFPGNISAIDFEDFEEKLSAFNIDTEERRSESTGSQNVPYNTKNNREGSNVSNEISDDGLSQDSNGEIIRYEDCYDGEEQITAEQNRGFGYPQPSDTNQFSDSRFSDSHHASTDSTNSTSGLDSTVIENQVRVDELVDDTRSGLSGIKDSGYGGNFSNRNSKIAMSVTSRNDEDHFVDCYGEEDFKNTSRDVFQRDEDWEMFNRGGGSQPVAMRMSRQVKVPESCRPSVFVGFDPIYQQQVLDQRTVGVTGPVKNVEKRTKSTDSQDGVCDDLIQMSTPSKKSTTKTSRHPALRHLESQISGEGEDNVDHLLRMSPTVSDKGERGKSTSEEVSVGPQGIVEVLKYSQLDVNRIKKDMELHWNSRLLVKEKEWLAQNRELKEEIERLAKKNEEAVKSNEGMRLLVAEYEKTMTQLLTERDKIKSSSQDDREDVIRERDTAIEDLRSVEVAFSDLHRRYDKCKFVIDAIKQNEATLKGQVNELNEKLRESDELQVSVVAQAQEKLDEANVRIHKIKKTAETENAKTEAALKKKTLECQSLQTNFDQKVTENQELVAICDELIAKVGDS